MRKVKLANKGEVELIDPNSLVKIDDESDILVGSSAVARRRVGDLAGYGLYLPEAYDWEMVEDTSGVTVLIAKYKK